MNTRASVWRWRASLSIYSQFQNCDSDSMVIGKCAFAAESIYVV